MDGVSVGKTLKDSSNTQGEVVWIRRSSDASLQALNTDSCAERHTECNGQDAYDSTRACVLWTVWLWAGLHLVAVVVVCSKKFVF